MPENRFLDWKCASRVTLFPSREGILETSLEYAFFVESCARVFPGSNSNLVANVKEDTACGKNVTLLMEDDVLREESTMGKHLDPLEKELLIKRYLSNPGVKLRDFCDANNVSDGAFKKWLKQYKEQGIEGLARADDAIREILPDGVERTTENYKREILKLRIENERLKKNYTVRRTKDGEQEYIRLKPKNTR